MRLQQYINEEWIKLYPNKPKFEVLKNPSKKEITNLLTKNGRGRFIADGLYKILWLWDSYNGIHQDVYNDLWRQNVKFGSPSIDGEIKMLKGKWTMYRSDELFNVYYDKSPEEVEKRLKKFKWLEKYIDILYYINKVKEGL